jgi:hypothetical protein
VQALRFGAGVDGVFEEEIGMKYLLLVILALCGCEYRPPDMVTENKLREVERGMYERIKTLEKLLSYDSGQHLCFSTNYKHQCPEDLPYESITVGDIRVKLLREDVAHEVEVERLGPAVDTANIFSIK